MPDTTRLVKRVLWIGLLVLLGGATAEAHDLPNSTVSLDFQRGAVEAELTLPMSELAIACRLPLLDDPSKAVLLHGGTLRQYIRQRVQPVAPDGQLWEVQVRGLDVSTGQGAPDVVAHLTLSPRGNEPLRRFALRYSVVCGEVRSHAALVSVRNDWNNAVFSGQPRLLGVVQFPAESLVVDLTHGSFWQGFGAVLRLGMKHIAGGLDHLLFLLVLVLPAPLLAAGSRWGPFRGTRGSFAQLIKIVTAFTLGHSLTLLVGGMGWLRLPARPVEVLIAVSILVSALHALRPWFAGHEPWVAGGFGLVHGLAFASSVAGFGFSPWYLAMTILGFNLGIELMQLVLVLAAAPSLILASRTGFYPAVRITGASLSALAALAWIIVRIRA